MPRVPNAIARWLNERGYKTRRGGAWTATQVLRLVPHVELATATPQAGYSLGAPPWIPRTKAKPWRGEPRIVFTAELAALPATRDGFDDLDPGWRVLRSGAREAGYVPGLENVLIGLDGTVRRGHGQATRELGDLGDLRETWDN